MQWLCVSIYTTSEGIESLSDGLCELGVGGVEAMKANERKKVEDAFGELVSETLNEGVAKEDQYDHFFAYMLLPLNHDYPKLLLHVSPSPDGHLRESELRRIRHLHDAGIPEAWQV